MKLCWLMTMFQSDAASAHRRPSLVSDKHAPALQFQSVSPCRLCCTGVVFMQPLVKENDAYYCDVLLLKQLLPDICQAAGDLLSSASRVHKSTELLRHKTSHQTRGLSIDQTSVP